MVHVTLLLSAFIASIKKKTKASIVLAFTILILFAALRYNFGNDYRSYLNNDILIRSGETPLLKDWLFVSLERICPSFYVFIAITSLISIIPVYYLIKDFVVPEYRYMAFIIYCINPYLFLISLSSIRQALAIAFFILAVRYSLKRKPVPYMVCILIAILFHISAIVLIPFYFIANDRKVDRIQLTVVIMTLLTLLFAKGIFNSLIQLGLDLFGIANYRYYASLGGTNSLRATLLSSIYLIYVLINIRKMKGATLAFSKLYIVGCILSILAYRLNMLTRFQMYFDIFSVVSIPMTIMMNNSLIVTSDRKYRMINRYAFPILIFTIYALRYYSFFNNPMWKSFTEYHTVISLIFD